ncbi:MAG: ATP-binding protein, partial [Pseudomonadota bacterium]
ISIGSAFVAGAGAAVLTVAWDPMVEAAVGAAALGLGAAGLVWTLARKSRERDRRLISEAVEAMPIPLAIYDRDERLAVSNALYRAHHADALSRRAARGETRRPTYRELVEEGIDPTLPEPERRAAIAKRLAAQAPEDGSLVERSYPGIGWLRVARRRLSGGGSVRVAIGIDELKRREADLMNAVERAEASEAAREKFLAAMTHELRTPLNGVIGMAAVVLEGELSADQRRNLRMIHGSGMHLLRLIDTVLDYSNLKDGEAEVGRPEPFDAVALVEETTAEAAFAAAAGVETRVTVAPDFARWRRGDARGFRRIVSNLLGNAVKFTERGAVEAVLSGSANRLRVDVRDTGVGVPADRLGAIFEPFEQGDPSITRRFGGAGLGLSIAAEIAAAMGGGVEVESREGAGSVFALDLPLPAIAEEAAAPAPPARAEAAGGGA